MKTPLQIEKGTTEDPCCMVSVIYDYSLNCWIPSSSQ